MVADIVVVSTFLVARIFMMFLPFAEFVRCLMFKICFQLIGRSDWKIGSNFFNFYCLNEPILFLDLSAQGFAIALHPHIFECFE